MNRSFYNHLRSFSAWLRHTKQRVSLPMALMMAVLIALASSITSTYLYVSTGTSTLDLSRPGYERQREAVKSPITQEVFDSEGPISKRALNQFLGEFDKRNAELDNYSNFTSPALEDSELQLNAGAPTAGPQ